jgi:hypothetical protein
MPKQAENVLEQALNGHERVEARVGFKCVFGQEGPRTLHVPQGRRAKVPLIVQEDFLRRR